MGSRAESIFSSLGLGEEVGVYNAVKQAFDEYFSPRRYTIYERAKFFRRVQAEGESVEQFIRALNESAYDIDVNSQTVLHRSEIT